MLYSPLICFLQIAFWASATGYQQAQQPTLRVSVVCDFFLSFPAEANIMETCNTISVLRTG